MGIAYYGAYLDWFTVGRSDWLREAGIPYRERFEQRGIALAVMDARVSPVHHGFNGSALPVPAPVGLRRGDGGRDRHDRLKPARLRFLYRVGEHAEGETWHAVVDAQRRPCDLRKRDPDLWEALFHAYSDRR